MDDNRDAEVAGVAYKIDYVDVLVGRV